MDTFLHWAELLAWYLTPWTVGVYVLARPVVTGLANYLRAVPHAWKNR